MTKPKPKPPMPEITRYRHSEPEYEMFLTIFENEDDGLRAAIAKLKAQLTAKKGR